MKTNFFEQLAGLQNQSSLLLNIQPDDKGLLTVSVIMRRDNQTNESLPPMLLHGTAQELDGAFFETIAAPVQHTNGLLNNIDAYQATLEKAGKEAKEKAKGGKPAAPADDEKDDEASNLFTTATDDKEAKAEKKRIYDEQMQKVKTLAQQMKYAEALAQLPVAEDYPDKVELISAKKQELEKGKEIYDRLQNQFSD
ncbi:PRTRC system protein E [Mucilaginibacter conchicola]|uniref:PRTRC system protein E n=1 Tax=Mucilaginibacter conchicola TaxID=2303333 RepID=A0A372NNS4_9SPHI|nr:PRTRC system protein E [Mucilaginibacter conchicola]RFZ90257.1 PRTRC system protein E [Mucilaginibacter conchicola]